MAIKPAHRETRRVRFWSHTWVTSKNDTTNETRETMAEVGPTSEVVPVLLIIL
jgi:hypothetical protein